jgi:uncharacterized protein YrrD
VREVSSLINAEVISSKEGKRLGVISQVAFDLSAGRLLGVILGRGAAEKGVRAEDIKTWGPDVVMVEHAEAASRLSEMPELMAARRDPTLPPPQIITEAGQRLGRLGRVFLDSAALKIVRFEISGGAWRDLTEGVLIMPVVSGIIHGPDTIIVPTRAVSRASESSSLRSSVEKAAESVREGAVEGAKRLGEALETGSESLRGSAVDRAKRLGEALETGTESLREGAVEGAKRLGEALETGTESLKKTLNAPLIISDAAAPMEPAEPQVIEVEVAVEEPVKKPAKASKPKATTAKPAAKKTPKAES